MIFARLSERSERYADWLQVFGDTHVPLESPVPQRANLPGKPNAQIYKLAVKQLNPEQRRRLVDHLSRRFNVPAQEVEADLDGEHGMPILADDVFVSIGARLLV